MAEPNELWGPANEIDDHDADGENLKEENLSVINAFELNEPDRTEIAFKRNSSAKENPFFNKTIPDEVNLPITYV